MFRSCHLTGVCMLSCLHMSFATCMAMQEGNAETLQMDRQTEEEMRADFIAKSLG